MSNNQLFNVAEYTNLTKEEKKMYDQGLKYKWDNKNIRDYEIGEARKDERKKVEENFVLEMIKNGFSVEQISTITKLSIDEIEKLKSNCLTQ